MTEDDARQARSTPPNDSNGTRAEPDAARHQQLGNVPPILLHEEVLDPVVRETVRGRVIVRTRTETIEHDATVELQQDHVSVEHRPVYEEVETAPEPHWEGNTWVLPLVEEKIVIQKRLVVREEIRITIESGTERRVIPTSLRQEVAEITEVEANDEPTSST